jgi:ATP-dependent RNA helicase DeaD
LTTPASFADLPLHSTVAEALAARGYATATPVQAAVVAPELAARDLLVSAPTGSGKTVAFGTLIADKLLGPAREDAPARPKGAPRALVVAPTRELANQVSQELTWLLAPGRLSLGAFTGGTSVPGDLRRLRMGIDVAVGTPGRLVDLEKRGALNLSAIEALVLDEADEMLDLGFREALEHLLGVAPKERRTLLFSATMPPDITRMAATYLREPMRVDARGKSATAGHADIEYFAHLVRPQDRLAAVVNVLLGNGGKAIVFCRTREGVGELHQRLVDHGFRAAAISGDRAQGERDRALGALRSGRSRILVATNVAARGLDLPDVELVLHADLPENAEALTHRSGRTGRAGRKGKSVVIADMRERRKAERLLAGARTPARWTPAPTAHDVRRALIDGLRSELIEAVSGHESADGADEGQSEDAEGMDQTGERPATSAKTAKAASAKNRDDRGGGGMGAGLLPEEAAELADRLRAALPERVLIASLLGRELARLPAPLPLQPLDPNQRAAPPRMVANPRVGRERDERSAPPPRDGSVYGARGNYASNWDEAVLFKVNLGAAANAEPGWLLPLICRRGGVTRREVGAIRVGPTSSTFEIAAGAAGDFALSAAERDPRAPNVTIEPAGEGVGHIAEAPPMRGPRPSDSRTSDSRPSDNKRAPRASAKPASAQRRDDESDAPPVIATPKRQAPSWGPPAAQEVPEEARDEARDGSAREATTAEAPAQAAADGKATATPSAAPEPRARREAAAPKATRAPGENHSASKPDADESASTPPRAKARRERADAEPATSAAPAIKTPAPPIVDAAAALTGPGRRSAGTTNANAEPASDFTGFVATGKKPLRIDRAAPRGGEAPARKPPRPTPAADASATSDQGKTRGPSGAPARGRTAGKPFEPSGGFRDRAPRPGYPGTGFRDREGKAGFAGGKPRDRATRPAPFDADRARKPQGRAGAFADRPRFDGGPGRPSHAGADARPGRFGGVRRDAAPGFARRDDGPPRRGDDRAAPSRGARPRGFEPAGPARGPRFNSKPGAPARPSGRKDDRPPRGRPRSGP